MQIRRWAEFSLFTPFTITPKPKFRSEPVWVFVWDTDRDGVGHVAIQIGGEKPNWDGKSSDGFISFWPGLIPAIGPLAVAPLPPAFSNNLEEDCKSESKSPHETKLPDHVFVVKGLNTPVMQNEIKNIREQLEKGQVRYQLYPQVKGLHFFDTMVRKMRISTASIISGCPFSELPNETATADLNEAPHKEFSTFNCSSLVLHLLRIGGADLPPMNKWLPWGRTPSKLAEQVRNLKESEEIESLSTILRP